MLNILKKSAASIILFSAWLIMNDGASLFNIISGIIVSAICLFTTSYLLDFSYTKAFMLPPLKFIKYVLFLFKEIYISGIKATIAIITGKVNLSFVTNKINPNIKNVYLHNILATSITLTPGTITVDNTDGTLTVLTMHSENKNPGETFEPLLIEMEGYKHNITKR